jgi:hypothetical protein
MTELQWPAAAGARADLAAAAEAQPVAPTHHQEQAAKVKAVLVQRYPPAVTADIQTAAAGEVPVSWHLVEPADQVMFPVAAVAAVATTVAVAAVPTSIPAAPTPVAVAAVRLGIMQAKLPMSRTRQVIVPALV